MFDPVAELAQIERKGLLRRRRILESAQGVRIRADGRDWLSFCSNDYLGLASDPRIAQAAAESILEHGLGAGASHLVSGHHRAHEELEHGLAGYVGLPRALLFGSGYLANLAVVTCLATRTSEIFADRLNHASLNDAMILSRARFRRYSHLDVDALESLLAHSRAEDKLVITDSVFSMDGDIAPLPAIVRACERHGAWLVVDDAHGFGVLGENGRGVLSHFGMDSDRVAYIGTLGKAAGVSGAFVAGSAALIDLLVQRARSYIYTTATPPALAAAVSKSLEIMRDEGWRRERLAASIARFSSRFSSLKWRLLPSITAIQPVVVGDNETAVSLAGALDAAGLLVPAIRPPTVPRGSARLRVSITAAHVEDDIDSLADTLRDIEVASA